VKLVANQGHLEVLVGSRYLHEELRSGRVTKYVARISHVPGVRGWMLGFQRDCLRFGSLVMDGRDIGTRIFRETPFKFYLTADPAVRRARGQNASHGGGGDFRDAIDADLNHPAADALIVDTSEITAAQAVEMIVAELRRLAPGRFRAGAGASVNFPRWK
jgi:cytidylate kinase